MILPLVVQDAPGLVAWRRPDARGQSCVSCHSPDGIELSAFGFSRENVLRRAVRHLPADDGEAIVAMLRRRKASGDAMRDRPLQPGGVPLPGSTPAARDLAFLRTLPAVVPTLAAGRVDSEASALKVRDEALRIDLTKLRIGIPFNRLSEDGFHGREHRTVAHWFPDVPIAKVDPAAGDRYLKDPTDANLRALDVRGALNAATSPGELLALSKYRSLLILQHRLRTGRLTPLATPGTLVLNQNPFWDVADFARRYEEETDVASLGFPADVATGKQGGPSYRDQLKALRLPWFWMGWELDPALQTSGLNGETQRADYFVRYLWKDGPYPAHLAFMLTKKLVEQGYNPRLWNEPRFPQRYEISFSDFLMGEELGRLELGGEYGRRFVRLAGNALRTGLYLSRKSVRETGEAFHPEAQANQVRLALAYLHRVDPRPADEPLAKNLLALLAKARPLR